MTQALSILATPASRLKSTDVPLVDSLRAARCAQIIVEGFLHLRAQCRAITMRAGEHFELRDWHGAQTDFVEIQQFFQDDVDSTLNEVRQAVGEHMHAKSLWRRIRQQFINLTEGLSDTQLAQTFFNIIVRNVFHSREAASDVGMDVCWETSELFGAVELIRIDGAQSVEAAFKQLLMKMPLEAEFADISASAMQIANVLRQEFASAGDTKFDRIRIEALNAVMYRFTTAYIIGRVTSAGHMATFALMLCHADTGVIVERVLLNQTELRDVFSCERASFQVELESVAASINYLHRLLPGTTHAQWLAMIGYKQWL